MTDTTTPLATDLILAEAESRGRARGEAAASWVFDGNTAPETYRAFLSRFEEGSPRVEDIAPTPSWLSGEWAGESITELLGDLIGDYLDADGRAPFPPEVLDDDNGESPDAQALRDHYAEHWDEAESILCEAYESAADQAYWDALETAARSALSLD